MCPCLSAATLPEGVWLTLVLPTLPLVLAASKLELRRRRSTCELEHYKTYMLQTRKC